ncbi:MAG: DUF4271 domain-containing protein [Saprospiraceae bacterium]|nr:DUF4271 domain-containing protein [Saprospiraceae bacterium]
MHRSQNAHLIWPIVLISAALLVASNGYAQQNPFEIKNRLTKDTNSQPPKDSVSRDTVIQDSTLQGDLATADSSLLSDTLLTNGEFPDQSLDSFSVTTDLFIPSEVHDFTTWETAERDELTHQDSGGLSESSEMTADGLIDQLDQIDIDHTLIVNNRNLLFGISILILLLLASLLAVNRSLIKKSYRAIANDNYLRFLHREYRTMPWLYWLFYLHFFMDGGFFVYLLIHQFGWYTEGSLLVLLVCILCVLGAYVVKHLSLSGLAQMFPIDKEVQLYGFVTMLINILLGLALLPVNLLVAFAPMQIVSIAIWLGIVLIVVLYFFRQLKGLFISGRLVTSYLFHFFLYLCTAEIAPLLIVGKLALGNFGGH